MAHDLGQVVTSLGCAIDGLSDDALVSDAVVLLKCIQADGTVTLMLAHSEGMSWIERLGMLHAAVQIETQDYRNVD